LARSWVSWRASSPGSRGRILHQRISSLAIRKSTPDDPIPHHPLQTGSSNPPRMPAVCAPRSLPSYPPTVALPPQILTHRLDPPEISTRVTRCLAIRIQIRIGTVYGPTRPPQGSDHQLPQRTTICDTWRQHLPFKDDPAAKIRLPSTSRNVFTLLYPSHGVRTSLRP
jgi:hypothetical protein